MMRSIAGALSILAIALLCAVGSARGADEPVAPSDDAFARDVDLSPLGAVAVHYQGRLKSFESFAFSVMKQVTGPRGHEGRPHGFTYLDMLLAPERYANTEIVWVKSKLIRATMAGALEGRHDWPRERLNSLLRTGNVAPPTILEDQAVRERLGRIARDAIKAKHVEQVETALHLMSPAVLGDRLRILPPESGDATTPWMSVVGLHDAPAGPVKEAWAALEAGWRERDAAKVTAAARALADALPAAGGSLYPPRERLLWEARYFRLGGMTWGWLVYLVSVAFLLMGVVYRWKGATRAGAVVFLGAFALHSFALGLRWYASGRWPNSNMFEAVTTAAWFGGAAAVVIEALARRTAMRGVFFLGSACASMIALMATRFLPVSLTPDIGNKMPVLHDIWLYIHTNVIIFSYCLIAMGAVTSLLYVLHRLGGGQPDFARAGGAGSFLSSGRAAPPDSGALRAERAGRVSFAAMLDGATMTVMELSFIMLFAGTIMGAVWADHSWGRPWGWDPKEVFALATFLVYAVLVHVRLKVRDKGLWTAVLALVGFAVMIFNWTVINFVITGLHSYA